MSQIRELLRQAQQAELAGDLTQAIEVLKSARDWYRHNNSPELSLRMERQIGRLVEKVQAANAAHKESDAMGSSVGVTALSPLLYTSRSPLIDGGSLPSQTSTQPAIPNGRPSKRSKSSGPTASTAADPKSKVADAPQSGLVGSSSRWCSFCLQPESAVGSCWEGAGGATLCRACAERMVGEMANVRGSAGAAAALAVAPSLSKFSELTPIAYPEVWPWQQRWSDRISALAGRSWLVVAPQGFGLRRVLNGFQPASGLVSSEISAAVAQGLRPKPAGRSKKTKVGSTAKKGVAAVDGAGLLEAAGAQAVGLIDGGGRKAVVVSVPRLTFHGLHQWLVEQPLDAPWASGLHAIVALTPPSTSEVLGAAQPYFGKVAVSVRAQWELMTRSGSDLDEALAATPFLARWTQLMRAVNAERP